MKISRSIQKILINGQIDKRCLSTSPVLRLEQTPTASVKAGFQPQLQCELRAVSQVPIYHRAPLFFDRIAIIDNDGEFTYEDVFRR